ncbi:uncharacterized protein LOC101852245 [Aplysia californica]|uniref:Uncharacterized protein LOC101852245 n=1 Tax=Aplysia californica TaxID=6500 RepID=A0ABM0JQG9_APLCA|nr:uncharacterized protein LOC101852245 [Aplysia californica]
MMNTGTTPAPPEVYSTNSKQLLVTRDPVYVHPTIRQGHFVGLKPHNYLYFAIVATLINPVIGAVAIVFALKSDSAFNDGDVHYATKWSNYAFLTGIIGIVTSVILGVAIGFALAGPGLRGGHSY